MTQATQVEENVETPPSVSGNGTPPRTDDGKPKADEEASQTPGGTATYGDVHTQILGSHIGAAYFGTRPPKALAKLLVDLPDLPRRLHPFRDPQHESLVKALTESHVIVLVSHREDASYAAAHSLLNDTAFSNRKRRALYPDSQQEKQRDDVELMSLASEGVLGNESQVLLVEIKQECTFLQSVIYAGNGIMGSVCQNLRKQDSYLVLSLDETLLKNDDHRARIRDIGAHHVSYLRYLLSRNHADRAGDLETRLLEVLGPRPTPKALAEHYDRVADEFMRGADDFERYLANLGRLMQEPQTADASLQRVDPAAVFREDAEAHRSAAFVAAYLPQLSQRDFDFFVRLLLGDETTPVETKRPAFRRDGRLLLIQEERKERWSDRWSREADRVFRDCHLRTVVSGSGSWVVDFTEPYLRDELRKHVETNHPWYLRRQCQRLQNTGVFFDPDLSPTAVEGLVQLFVERAVVDPTGFGSNWLLDLVVDARAALTKTPRPKDVEKTLEWLGMELAKARLRDVFLPRLTMLVRAMLDREALRDVVDEFLTRLIRTREHEALLDVILELAPRLRFVPYFDPLVWMRRLLDQGSAAVMRRTIDRLAVLACDSRLRIYEVLGAIHSWLPEEGRSPDQYSISNRVALEFPFLYSAAMAERVDPGVWPSQHALFNALPDDPEKARHKLSMFIEWVLDARGASLEKADAADPRRSAEAVRIEYVADLIEHWAWVLEGEGENGPAEGRALFRVITNEIEARIGPRERTWLQRTWQQRQDEMQKAASDPAKDSAARRIPLARKKKLELLRLRFTKLPGAPREL